MIQTAIHAIPLAWLGDITLQATLILSLALLSQVFRLSAARRHVLLAAGLLAIPVLMLGTGVGPSWRVHAPAAAGALAVPAMVPSPAIPPAAQPTTSAPPPTPSGPAAAVFVRNANPQDDTVMLTSTAVMLWLAGIATGLVILLISAGRLRRLRSRSQVLSEGRLHDLFVQCCTDAGLTRHPTLLLGPAGMVPMTWGLWRKQVLLPAEAGAWTDQHALLVLRHELAHVTRHDMLASLLTTLSALVLWFHPLVWLTLRACHQTREAACDDLALQQSGTPPESFASQLLQAITATGPRSARRFAPLALTMAEADKVMLKKRLASLLDHEQPRAPWGHRSLASLVAMGIGVVFLCTGFSACRQEEKKAPQAQAQTPAPKKPFTGTQVQISTKVFSVPLASPVLADFGFIVDRISGLQLGVVDQAKVIALLERLRKEPGVTFISAPNVVTKFGKKVNAEVVREMIYPTEFTPPHLSDPDGSKIIQMKPGEALPVVPATPTAFEMRPVGLRMEFTPELSSDVVIDMAITTEYTVFEGFVNYGSPVKGNAMGKDGAIHEVTLSDNKIQQPIFHTSKWTTSVSFQDGDYLVMGGLGARVKDERISIKKPELNPASMTDNAERDLIFFVIEARTLGK